MKVSIGTGISNKVDGYEAGLEAAALYIGRCVELIARPPAGVWDGTTVLSGK